jgi:hypothetical protein
LFPLIRSFGNGKPNFAGLDPMESPLQLSHSKISRQKFLYWCAVFLEDYICSLDFISNLRSTVLDNISPWDGMTWTFQRRYAGMGRWHIWLMTP